MSFEFLIENKKTLFFKDTNHPFNAIMSKNEEQKNDFFLLFSVHKYFSCYSQVK